jgi:hypothetical protein
MVVAAGVTKSSMGRKDTQRGTRRFGATEVLQLIFRASIRYVGGGGGTTDEMEGLDSWVQLPCPPSCAPYVTEATRRGKLVQRRRQRTRTVTIL